jgi:pseudouridine-5'-phosphate glycosidase
VSVVTHVRSDPRLPHLSVSDEVREAIHLGRPVVALESSLISQGLPVPHNLETALAAEAAVRDSGATPATVALEEGWIVVGAQRPLLERLADPAARAAKAASRDLGPLLAERRLASTTVSATMRAARMAGIRIFATGGIGGVHRGASRSYDISSDIDELAATPVAVLSSGAKSILDLAGTLEQLETRRVPVIGLGVDEMPAFYSISSGLPVPHSVVDDASAARTVAIHLDLPGAAGMLLVQPPPADLALDSAEVEAWIEQATVAAERDGNRGGQVTPYVLARVAEASGGRTLRANIGLIVNNARAAGRIAVELSTLEKARSAG